MPIATANSPTAPTDVNDASPANVSTATPAPAPPAPPSPEEIHRAFESGRYPYKRKMARRTYEAEKARLQAELLKVQIWAQETGQKFVMPSAANRVNRPSRINSGRMNSA